MKILIRLPNWLGDVVMSTAFIGAVRQLYPDAEIDVIIKKELGSIASLIPGINQTYLFSKKEHKGLQGAYRFGRSLRANKYDIFFNLPHSLSSNVLAWATSAKKRMGFNKEGGFFLMTNTYSKPRDLHRVDEYICLLEHFTGKEVHDRRVNMISSAGKLPNNKTIVINFNSEASSRRMPVDKGRSIVSHLVDNFTDHRFAVVGSPREAAYVGELLAGLNNSRIENLSGKTSITELAELMAGSTAVLSTDSGPAHLANALGIPTVALFGAGNEANTAPYNKDNLAIVRYGQLNCEPCVRNKCRLYGIPKCMQLLDENKIIKALSLQINNA
ncbi:glycosyltransferase family 9 protein [Mucilaginibacter pallidiroseus]|uniref:Glycosyltransferase family 9 protein n=1 Tax=Mucilaginibacter pallidiroseus TaxID=2599295 RepID=A0A563UD33_9SPHI|nr:glycosyltransferase family 9 protein [Mucilaginibacter pallidiroseus]TWR29244.1 glycosyltransferase family 9 protein [Mucilaginibacter pallidiroseus]